MVGSLEEGKISPADCPAIRSKPFVCPAHSGRERWDPTTLRIRSSTALTLAEREEISRSSFPWKGLVLTWCRSSCEGSTSVSLHLGSLVQPEGFTPWAGQFSGPLSLIADQLAFLLRLAKYDELSRPDATWSPWRLQQSVFRHLVFEIYALDACSQYEGSIQEFRQCLDLSCP